MKRPAAPLTQFAQEVLRALVRLAGRKGYLLVLRVNDSFPVGRLLHDGDGQLAVEGRGEEVVLLGLTSVKHAHSEATTRHERDVGSVVVELVACHVLALVVEDKRYLSPAVGALVLRRELGVDARLLIAVDFAFEKRASGERKQAHEYRDRSLHLVSLVERARRFDAATDCRIGPRASQARCYAALSLRLLMYLWISATKMSPANAIAPAITKSPIATGVI